MNRNLLLLLLVSMLSVFHANAQTSTDQIQKIFGEVVADSVWTDMKAHKVHTIEKVMNEGKEIMSATLDRKGRLIRYQYKQGFVADSMVYDAKDRLVRQYQVGPAGPMGYRAYVYNDSVLTEEFYKNKAGKRTEDSKYQAFAAGDTGIYISRNTDGSATVTRSYLVGDTAYVIIIERDELGATASTTIVYTVYDKPYQQRTHKNRILEYGELDYDKGLTDVIEALPDNEKPNMNDESTMRDIYLIYDKKTSDSLKRAIVSKRFPSLVNYIGVRRPYYHYQYDDVHNGRVSDYWNDMQEHFSYQYNSGNRVVSVTKTSGIDNVSTLQYHYDNNGLLQSVTSEEAVITYRYSFY